MVAKAQRDILIDRWFPVTEASVESGRERGASSALLPLYYLHVWFARRSLVASRSANLGSILPDDVSKDLVVKILGIPQKKPTVIYSEEFCVKPLGIVPCLLRFVSFIADVWLLEQ